MIELLGIIAATITSIASFPQLIKTWKTKKADDLSYGLLIFLITGIGLWIVYGIMIKSIGVMLESAVSLASILGIFTLKVIYRKK